MTLCVYPPSRRGAIGRASRQVRMILPAISFVLIAVATAPGVASTEAEADLKRVNPMPSKTSHPFLICTRDQFPELRRRAEREPWKSMKADAIKRVEAGFNGNFRNGLQRYIGAVALVYILDPDNSADRADQVRDAILLLEEADFDPSQSWVGTVPPMGAAFVAILALDIVHDDLTPEEIERCKALIETQTSRINRRGAWLAARLGTHGTWELFKNPAVGETADFRRKFVEPFYRNYVRQMTPDGVTTVSPGYAFARLGSGSDRPQKTGFADVLEFTGIDRRYYDNPKLENFHRWLFGYSVTPAKEYHLFGDVGPNWGVGNAALLWRVGRFDERAAAYAAWLLEDRDPPGHILSYILMQEPLPEPTVPQSRLFAQGGAVFREPTDSPMSLGAALYNITENPEWHTHEEVNAISVAAYGNNLLVNGGWLGDETRPPSRNNTLAVDGKRHQKMVGAGLAEGFTSEGLDYACGDSGRALGDDSFHRSLVLVHGDPGTQGGYFITFDEVDADPGEKVHSYLQLASENEAEPVVDRRQYRATINHHAKYEGVEMDVLLPAGPEYVEQELVPSGYLERVPSVGKHYRLEAVYDTNEQGDRRILTVLFPVKENQNPPDPQAIDGEGYTGALLVFSRTVMDLILESDGTRAIEHGNLTCRAKLAVARTINGIRNEFYFARHGTMLRHGDVGFASDRPISIHMNGAVGNVTSRGASVTFHYPGITGVRVSGEAVEPAEVGEGRVRIEVPAGRHTIELISR